MTNYLTGLLILFSPFTVWAATNKGKIQNREIVVHQDKRSYSIYVPNRYSEGKKLPLLLALHGGKGNGEKLENKTALSKEAESRGFILVYPNGEGGHWNDGRKETSRMKDDLSFLTALVASLQKEFSIDARRIYLVGISNGGMMALRLACDTENIFAGFTLISASMPNAYLSSCKGKSMPPLLFIASPTDPIMPWNGGEVQKGSSIGRGGGVLSVPDALEYWRARGGCGKAPIVKALPDKDPKDGTSVEHTSYQACASGKLELYKVIGGGHPWPSGRGMGAFRERIVGKTTREIGNQEILNFFGL